MTVGDVAAVAAIEARSFSPWSMAQVAAELQRETGLGLVAIGAGGEIEAWCCAFQAGTDAELLKVTVRFDKRRRGTAEALLLELCSRFAGQGMEQMFLEVRSQNHPALQLYAKLGWRETGRRKNYYKVPVDDAVILVRRFNKDKG